MNNPAEYTNYSGGAKGADMEWDRVGRLYEVINHIHYRPGHIKHLLLTDPTKYGVMLTDIYAASIALGRPYSFKGIELVYRNWLQVYNSSAIFAISYIISPGEGDFKGFVNNTGKEIVAGGTGWAVEMAIQKGKPVYVFDMQREKWYIWWHDLNCFVENLTPELTKQFAGIGSRELSFEGKQAIEEVYKQTFPTTKTQ